MANPVGREYSRDLDKTGIDPTNPLRVTRYALIPVIVRVILENGRVSPDEFRECTAMIDTGATTSAVTKSLAEDLGLRVGGKEVGLGIAEAPTERTLYRAHVDLPDLGNAWDAAFIETEAGQGIFDVIIGNDILSAYIFNVDGPVDKFTLRYAR
jgi:gag-polyprotein putative aspartyl protease